MSAWLNAENVVLVWLAGTRTGSVVKVTLGACLAWLVENLADYQLPAVVAIAITAAVPVIINQINPADSRYGAGKIDD